MRAISNERCIRFNRKVIEDLTVTEKKHHTRLHNVLEDEILIIVADLDNIGEDEIIKTELPRLVVITE